MSIPTKAYAAVNEKFRRIVGKIVDEFGRSGREVENYFRELFGQPVFGRTFLHMLLSQEREITLRDKLAVVAAYEVAHGGANISNRIYELMDVTEQPPLSLREYSGYYRFWSPAPFAKKEQLVPWGVINLSVDEVGQLRVSLWSHEIITERSLSKNNNPIEFGAYSNPEETGFGFIVMNRLFLLTFSRKNMRFTECTLPFDTLASSKIRGLLLTTAKITAQPFSAGILMAHESNPASRKPMTWSELHGAAGFSSPDGSAILT
jgi:hypothetical protein